MAGNQLETLVQTTTETGGKKPYDITNKINDLAQQPNREAITREDLDILTKSPHLNMGIKRREAVDALLPYMAQAYSNRNPDVARALAGILTQQAPAYQQADLEMAKDMDNRLKVDTLAKMQERIEQGNDPMRKAQLMSLTNSVLGTTLDPKSLQFQYSMMDDLVKLKASALITQANLDQASAPKWNVTTQSGVKEVAGKNNTTGEDLKISDAKIIGEKVKEFQDSFNAMPNGTTSISDVFKHANNLAGQFPVKQVVPHIWDEASKKVNEILKRKATDGSFKDINLQNLTWADEQMNLGLPVIKIVNPFTKQIVAYNKDKYGELTKQISEWAEKQSSTSGTANTHTPVPPNTSWGSK
jgi:hypothetical protein